MSSVATSRLASATRAASSAFAATSSDVALRAFVISSSGLAAAALATARASLASVTSISFATASLRRFLAVTISLLAAISAGLSAASACFLIAARRSSAADIEARDVLEANLFVPPAMPSSGVLSVKVRKFMASRPAPLANCFGSCLVPVRPYTIASYASGDTSLIDDASVSTPSWNAAPVHDAALPTPCSESYAHAPKPKSLALFKKPAM